MKVINVEIATFCIAIFKLRQYITILQSIDSTYIYNCSLSNFNWFTFLVSEPSRNNDYSHLRLTQEKFISSSHCNESKIMRTYVKSVFYISLIESNFKHETLHKYHYVLHQYIVHYSSIYKESVIQLVTELMCVIVTPSSNK